VLDRRLAGFADVNRETALMFGARHAQVGVLSSPASSDAKANNFAVIFINAGLIHHVGPNRLHVRLARALAAAGVASLRLDLSGVGDSPPRADHLSIYELVRREPGEAMDALAERGFRRFVLVGLCSGAYSAFHVACDDARVAAAVMIHPEDLSLDGTTAGTDLSAAWSRRYWTNSVFRPRAWLNLLSGRVNYRRLLETVARRFKAPSEVSTGLGRGGLRSRMLQAMHSRNLTLLFISSSDDVSREYLDLILDSQTLRQAPTGALQRQTIDECDHLFTRLEDQRRLVDFLVPWTTALASASAASPGQRFSTTMSPK
jgi:pimeloyl-ACP methyl ester carboxylesterase